MVSTRTAWQIGGASVLQIDWNLRQVLPKAVAVGKSSMDLKIWMMSSFGNTGDEFANMADLSKGLVKLHMIRNVANLAQKTKLGGLRVFYTANYWPPETPVGF